MDKDTLKLLEKLEEITNQLEEHSYIMLGQPERERMEKACYEVLGYKEHTLWHINFNSHKFKDIEGFYNFHNIRAVESHDKLVRATMEDITSNVDDLFLIYNKYLIDKEKSNKNQQYTQN